MSQVSKDALAQLWRKRLDEISRSELTIEKWCKLNKTTPRQYGYWRKKLGSKVKQRVRPTEWMAVEMTEPQPCPALPSVAPPSVAPPSVAPPSRLILHIAGAEVAIDSGFDPVLLRAVVLALGSQ